MVKNSNLIENIDKIKDLLYKNNDVYQFNIEGLYNKYPGVKVEMVVNEVKVGHGYYLNMVDAKYSDEVFELYLKEKNKNLIYEKTNIFFHSLFVDKNFRNKGYGKKIFERVVKEVKNNGFDKLFLTVNKTNNNALSLYENYFNTKVDLGKESVLLIFEI